MHALYRGGPTSRAGADESCVRGEAIRDALSRWVGFSRFIDDGRIENEYHIVERSMQENPLRRFQRRGRTMGNHPFVD